MDSQTTESDYSEFTEAGYEDWMNAARKYAEKNLDLWPFQVEQMADEFASRWEDISITEEHLNDAYEEWIAGENPYSGVHRVELDGYDKMGQYEHDANIAKREMLDLAISSMGMDSRSAELMVEHIYREQGASVGIYNTEKYYRKWIELWLSGQNRLSPHHVPLDRLNLLEREERAADLRFEDLLKKGRGWEMEFFDPGYMPDLS